MRKIKPAALAATKSEKICGVKSLELLPGTDICRLPPICAVRTKNYLTLHVQRSVMATLKHHNLQKKRRLGGRCDGAIQGECTRPGMIAISQNAPCSGNGRCALHRRGFALAAWMGRAVPSSNNRRIPRRYSCNNDRST